MKWQCYLNTNMGWQLVIETFPNQFNRNDVIIKKIGTIIS